MNFEVSMFYILVLYDPQIHKTVLDRSISKARVYLEQQLSSVNDSYSLCIISYALVLAKSSKANLALSKRDALAIVRGKCCKFMSRKKPLS